jgi:hypothetical protein
MNTIDINELVSKYYDDLETIVNHLAEKCLGGEKVSINFAAGKVTIKLK